MLLDKVVIGSCLASACYAFLNDCYYMPLCDPPLFYKKVDIRFLGSDREDYSWSRILLTLSLQGKLLNYKDFESAKISDKTLKIISKNCVVKYTFDLCLIFDSTGIDLENDIIEARKDTYIVYDDFELSNLGKKHKYIDCKISNEDLGRRIEYYISERVDGASFVTDCVVESELTKDQINTFEYSDTMARFLVERHLASLGIMGNFMKYYNSGKPKYRKPKVTHKTRVVRRRENTLYADLANVKIMKLNLGDVFSEDTTARP